METLQKTTRQHQKTKKKPVESDVENKHNGSDLKVENKQNKIDKPKVIHRCIAAKDDDEDTKSVYKYGKPIVIQHREGQRGQRGQRGFRGKPGRGSRWWKTIAIVAIWSVTAVITTKQLKLPSAKGSDVALTMSLAGLATYGLR